MGASANLPELCELLRDIARKGEQLPKKELKSRLFVVQIMVEQDLPMIMADLLPPLRKLFGRTSKPDRNPVGSR